MPVPHIPPLRIALLHETRPEVVPAHLPHDAFMEFDPPETIDAIIGALQFLGHEVVAVDSQRNPLQSLLQAEAIDLVLNCSAGFGSRFRELMPAALCEHLTLPYTGSDPMAQALSANKHVTKLMAVSLAVKTPRWMLAEEAGPRDFASIGPNVIVKPNFEGTSIGIRGPLDGHQANEVTRTVLEVISLYRQPVIVEEFIAGYEVTVPVLGNPAEALAPLVLAIDGMVRPSEVMFDSVRKSDSVAGIAWIPAPFSAGVLDTLRNAARTIHDGLGCRDLSRSDFRVTESGDVYFLELNATPQLTPGDCFMASGGAATFPELLQRIIGIALSRSSHKASGS